MPQEDLITREDFRIHEERDNERFNRSEARFDEVLRIMKEEQEENKIFRDECKPMLSIFNAGGTLKRGVIGLIAFIGSLVAIAWGVKNLLK